MQTIDDCYEFIKLVANKNQQGFISPTQFNRAWDSAELSLFKDRDDKPEDYQPGRPVARVAFGMSRKVSDDLGPFVQRAEYLPTAATPYWTRPAGMVRPLAAVAAYGTSFVEVEDVSPMELGGRLSSTIMPPTLEDPILVYGAGQAQVYPPAVPRVLIDYLAYPVPGKWVGILTNGRLVYDPANSTQPKWPRDCWNELCVRALSFLGMNLKAQDLVQYAQVKEKQGI